MSADFNRNHPECATDEIFVANVDDDSWSEFGWHTKRRGNNAYTLTGELIGSREGLFPVFVKKDEVEKRHPQLLKTMGRE